MAPPGRRDQDIAGELLGLSGITLNLKTVHTDPTFHLLPYL